MEIFHWSDRFLTELKDVDDQHHHLVDLINKFSNTLLDDKADMDFMGTIIKELVDYADYHFREEESLMQSVGIDPRFFDNHVAIHRHFIEEVNKMALQMKGDVERVSSDLLEYLRHWLAFHILKQDMEMSAQIKAIKKGVSPVQAYQHVHKEQQEEDPLVDALDGLFKILTKRNEELAELNASLEKKVTQRTRELKEANLGLEKLSLTDFLTQLPNRRYCMQMLEHAFAETLEKGFPLSCLMLDADHFKEVNDTYGHDAGDEVLIKLAHTIKDSSRSDDIVCRLGGDEFFIVCPKTSNTGALNLANQILNKVRDLHIPVGDGFWDGSVSIGVASYSEKIATADDLVKLADESVYLAKKNGKNRVETFKN